MATPEISVDVDLSGLHQFWARVDAELNNQRTGPVEKAIKQWGVRYRSFVQERFDKFSKGGGDWPQLAASTLARRRKGKRPKGKGTVEAVKASILRDMGILFAVLAPVFSGKPGALQEHIPFGIRVGFGGPHKHGSGGNATIADIASFHNDGAGHLPKREIIVAPLANVVTAMANDMEKALKQLGDEIK